MLKDHLLPACSQLNSIARDCGLVQRRSHKFSPGGFLTALLQAVTKGDTSLNQLAMHLSAFETTPMSRQAIHQRFGPASSSFLLQVIAAVLARRFPEMDQALRDCAFRRVLLEDSTVISMARSNADHFPNNGNGRFETAGCKCLMLIDLLAGQPIDFQLHAARQSDQSLAYEALEFCREGDLLVRDMGFFNLTALREVERRKAFWMTRLPASAGLASHCGKPLGEILKSSKTHVIDQPVLLGREKLPCRLIAFRLDPVRAEANRRLIRSESKRRGVTPNKETLDRAAWRILVTNVPKTMLKASLASEIYTLRWSIEIRFRAFKQSCQISRCLKHRGGFHAIEAMVLAAMLYHLLTLKLHAVLAKKKEYSGWLSIEKLSDAFSIHLMRVCRNVTTEDFSADPRHLRYEARKRPNHWLSIIHALA